MDKRRYNGGNSTKATRANDMRLSTKSDNQKLIENISPFSEKAHNVLGDAINGGEKWAVELWFKYFYGMPKQTVDNNTNLTLDNFDLKEVIKFDNTKQ